MFIASQTTPLKCSQLTYHTSYLSKPPLQKVHSFPNHPLKKFIAYLPYFIAYLTSISQLSKPSPQKVHSLLNILHSLLTILHILLNTLHILWFSQLTYHTSYLSNLNHLNYSQQNIYLQCTCKISQTNSVPLKLVPIFFNCKITGLKRKIFSLISHPK